MKKFWLTLFSLGMICSVARADTRSSASYSVATEGFDAGGNLLSSASYSVKGSSAGLIVAIGSVVNPSITNKSGYVGQLYEVQGLSVTASPSSVNETATTQLSAAALLDDLTNLPALNPALVAWAVVSGPISSINASGLVTTSNVYLNTGALVSGTYQSNLGQANLTVLNLGNDDFGAYAGDQIDDSWQVQYFGQPPNALAGPNADADGTGQTNLFKFVAGLNPLDGSRFTLSIQPVSGQPARKNLIFQPLVSGRTYTTQFRTNLTTGSWNALPGTTQSDNGNQRTVTDTSAAAPKYYRVQISKP
jgi:hypothetical protein